MNSKRVARVIAIILAFLMLFSVIMIVVDSVTASARVTQAEIDRLRAQKREQEKKKQEVQSRINSIDFERMTELAKKRVLDDRITLTGEEIENIIETIDFFGLLIIEKQLEVQEAQAREDAQLQLYKRRVRDMEENGVISYMEILFDSTDFTDLLARFDFISDIMRADEKVYNDLIAAKNETMAAEEALRQTREEMEGEKVLLEHLYQELEEQLEEATALIAQIELDLLAERALRAEIQAAENQIQREINAKVEEKRRQDEADRIRAANRVIGSGDLRWPVPGHSTITSEFGLRRHPVFRVMRQHNGIDIAAPHGARVVAADDGTVIISSYDSGYGHYVVISHGSNRMGNNVTTLYAHLSSRGVKEGQSVAKGDTIGRVGSTGVSTGPHLHFEVSIGGNKTNPKSYL